MKKVYKIFIMPGAAILLFDRTARNCYDTKEEAQHYIEKVLFGGFLLNDDAQFLVLPVFVKDDVQTRS